MGPSYALSTKGPRSGQRTFHRVPEAVSKAMGATFSGRQSGTRPRYVFQAAVTPRPVGLIAGHALPAAASSGAAVRVPVRHRPPPPSSAQVTPVVFPRHS